MISFEKKEQQTPHLKGVFFGDAGSGKSHLAKDFIVKSVEQTGNNNVILIDTESGWEWLKKDIQDVNVLEPNIDWSNKDIEITQLFQAIYSQINQNPVACVVIDSATHIGEFLYNNALKEVNYLKGERAKRYNKVYYPQTELEYQDWVYFNDKSDLVVNLIRKMQCHIVLCGRATSENAVGTDKEGKKIITEATERTVQGWKKISFEFDFSCLLKPSIDLTKKDNFKSFETYVIKSRFVDDGRVLKNNDFLQRWFSYFDKFDYESLKQSIISETNERSFLQYKSAALQNKNKMNAEQQTEMRNLLANKAKFFEEQK